MVDVVASDALAAACMFTFLADGRADFSITKRKNYTTRILWRDI